MRLWRSHKYAYDQLIKVLTNKKDQIVTWTPGLATPVYYSTTRAFVEMMLEREYLVFSSELCGSQECRWNFEQKSSTLHHSKCSCAQQRSFRNVETRALMCRRTHKPSPKSETTKIILWRRQTDRRLFSFI